MKLNFYDQTDWLSIGMCHDQTSYSFMFFTKMGIYNKS